METKSNPEATGDWLVVMDPVLPTHRIVVEDVWVKQEPVDTPQLFNAFKDRISLMYRQYFPDDAEFDLFCMLPVTEVERKVLVDRLIKQREQKDGPSQ